MKDIVTFFIYIYFSLFFYKLEKDRLCVREKRGGDSKAACNSTTTMPQTLWRDQWCLVLQFLRKFSYPRDH